MTISELIKELENFKKEHGDLPAYTPDTMHPWDGKITSLALGEKEKYHPKRVRLLFG